MVEKEAPSEAQVLVNNHLGDAHEALGEGDVPTAQAHATLAIAHLLQAIYEELRARNVTLAPFPKEMLETIFNKGELP